jgi:hypothetical protein
VAGELTSLYEAAMHAYLRANAFGGAFKWMLNDLDISHNPYEASFGVFKVGDQPKPIRDILARFSEIWPPVAQAQAGRFTAVKDLESGLSYRFDLPQQTIIGGHSYQDNTLSWRAEKLAGHCFIKKEATGELLIEALGSGQLSVNPWDLLPAWDRARESVLYQVFSERQRTRQRSFKTGESVIIDLGSGATYAVAIGAPVAPPSDTLPGLEPKPGEHVVLLGNSDQYLQAALGYIRRFAPDFTFVAETVAGRWAYVTVVATIQEVSDSVLQQIRSLGAILVERVIDDTTAATKARLDDLVRQGQRFLTAATPPSQEPPGQPAPPEKPPQRAETYVVQPGDTLGSIALKMYGKAQLWPVIFEANRDKISSPSLIRVGMELRIPPQA